MLYGTPTFGICFAWSRFQRFVLSCCFWKDCDICVLSSGLLSRAPRLRGEVVCPVVKDLICFSEFPLIPILHQSERSAVAVIFKSNRKFCSSSLTELVRLGFMVILVIPVSQFLVILLASADDLVLGEDGRNVWLKLANFPTKSCI